MCTVSINVTGSIGEVRFRPGSQLQHKGPLLHRRRMCKGGVWRTEKIRRGTALQSFTQHLEMFASCKEPLVQEDLGAGEGKGSQQFTGLNTQHSQQHLTPSWKAAVEEPTWSVKSLLALGQWCAQSYRAHICHTAVVTLSENVMLRVGGTVNILPIVLCTSAWNFFT